MRLVDVMSGAGLSIYAVVGLVLFMLTLVLNIIGNKFVARVREQY